MRIVTTEPVGDEALTVYDKTADGEEFNRAEALQNERHACTVGRLTVGAVVVAIMLLNLVVMIVARHIMSVLGIVLQILGAVLGVVQVALGLQIIINALRTLGDL